jgi:hypothetical protein
MSKTLGDCAYVWAFDDDAPDVKCMTVESYSIEKTPEFETEATDDDGNVAAVRRGPVKYTINASGYTDANSDLTCNVCKISLQGDTDLSGAGDLDGYVEKWSLSKTNNDFCKCELTAVVYAEAEVCCA